METCGLTVVSSVFTATEAIGAVRVRVTSWLLLFGRLLLINFGNLDFGFNNFDFLNFGFLSFGYLSLCYLNFGFLVLP